MFPIIIYWLVFFSISIGIFYAIKCYLERNKNDFEKRLDSYIPKPPLPLEREAYLEKRKRFVRRVFRVLIGFFAVIPLLFIALCTNFNFSSFWQGNGEGSYIFLSFLGDSILASIPFLGISFYWVYFVANRTTRAQEMLLAEMSEEDFQYFNLIRGRLYTPLFVVSRGKLYLFKASHIIENLIEMIRDIRIIYTWRRFRKIMAGVLIDHPPKKTKFPIRKDYYPYLTKLIDRYHPKPQYETL